MRRQRIPAPTLQTIWLAIPVLLVLWSALLNPLRRLDFWWHLKVGQIIVETGRIPTTDLFSFTAAGKPFTYPNWLAEIIFYLLWRVGGLELLVAFDAFMVALAFVLVLATCLQSGMNARRVALLALVPAVTFALYSNLRTQVFSFVLLAFYFWVLWNVRAGRRSRWLWLLPPLMAFWVNVHGAFVLGLGVLAGFLVSESVRRWWHGDAPDTIPPAILRRMALVLVLSALATLINPYGVQIYGYVRQLQQDPASQRFVTEWQPPVITATEHLLIFFAPFFIVLLGLLYSAAPLDLTELGLFMGFSVFALVSVRNGIWFAIAVAPIFVRHMQALRVQPLAHMRRRLGLPEPQSAPQRPRRESPVLNWLLVIVLASLTLLFSPWVRPHLQSERLRPTLIDPVIPVEAMDFIAEADLQGNIFHVQDFGDYMIWRLWPQQRTFIDGRVHLYSDELVEDYIAALSARDWEAVMDKYAIEYIFLPKPTEENPDPPPLLDAVRQSPNWRVRYEDDKSILFERVRSPET